MCATRGKGKGRGNEKEIEEEGKGKRKKERKGQERKGKDRKGRESKGRKGKEREGKGRKGGGLVRANMLVSFRITDRNHIPRKLPKKKGKFQEKCFVSLFPVSLPSKNATCAALVQFN